MQAESKADLKHVEHGIQPQHKLLLEQKEPYEVHVHKPATIRHAVSCNSGNQFCDAVYMSECLFVTK